MEKFKFQSFEEFKTNDKLIPNTTNDKEKDSQRNIDKIIENIDKKLKELDNSKKENN